MGNDDGEGDDVRFQRYFSQSFSCSECPPPERKSPNSVINPPLSRKGKAGFPAKATARPFVGTLIILEQLLPQDVSPQPSILFSFHSLN